MKGEGMRGEEEMWRAETAPSPRPILGRGSRGDGGFRRRQDTAPGAAGAAASEASSAAGASSAGPAPGGMASIGLQQANLGAIGLAQADTAALGIRQIDGAAVGLNQANLAEMGINPLSDAAAGQSGASQGLALPGNPFDGSGGLQLGFLAKRLNELAKACESPLATRTQAGTDDEQPDKVIEEAWRTRTAKSRTAIASKYDRFKKGNEEEQEKYKKAQGHIGKENCILEWVDRQWNAYTERRLGTTTTTTTRTTTTTTTTTGLRGRPTRRPTWSGGPTSRSRSSQARSRGSASRRRGRWRR